MNKFMHTLSNYSIEIYLKSSMYGGPEIKIIKIKSTKDSDQCLCSVSQSHNRYGVEYRPNLHWRSYSRGKRKPWNDRSNTLRRGRTMFLRPRTYMYVMTLSRTPTPFPQIPKMASVSPPATPASLPRPQLEYYTFVCHGCNIMLRGFTQELAKIEYVGPGHCSGCEFRTEDGYLVRGFRTL